MFTGIVEKIGIVVSLYKTKTGICLKIKADDIVLGIKVGDSIALNGVCLTVTDIKKKEIRFDVIHQTLRSTTLGTLKPNDLVNLERGLRPDSNISGHFVSGHIDYKGKICDIIKNREGRGLKISVSAGFLNFIVEKGSIALDGVSLTVAEVDRKSFTVYLIPHTLKVTTLGKKRKGDWVNVETDLLAKYANREKPSRTERLLREYEYI